MRTRRHFQDNEQRSLGMQAEVTRRQDQFRPLIATLETVPTYFPQPLRIVRTYRKQGGYVFIVRA